MTTIHGPVHVAPPGSAADWPATALVELIARSGPMLAGMARRIALPPMDPDDLLADAVANLLAKWVDGHGPRTNFEAYLIRTMRNRAADELRSPRSRVARLDDDYQGAGDQGADQNRIELHRELRTVQLAFAKLPQDYRTVLLATTVDGRKPAQLVVELNRPASAIYSLIRRARHALRRNFLQVMLEDGARDGCRSMASRIAHLQTGTRATRPDAAATAHLRTCDSCADRLERYRGMAS